MSTRAFLFALLALLLALGLDACGEAVEATSADIVNPTPLQGVQAILRLGRLSRFSPAD